LFPLPDCPGPVRTRQGRLWPQGKPHPSNCLVNRTREDGLDRTCPTRDVAAIGSMDASGQGPLMRTGRRQPTLRQTSRSSMMPILPASFDTVAEVRRFCGVFFTPLQRRAQFPSGRTTIVRRAAWGTAGIALQHIYAGVRPVIAADQKSASPEPPHVQHCAGRDEYLIWPPCQDDPCKHPICAGLTQESVLYSAPTSLETAEVRPGSISHTPRSRSRTPHG
jgi:hypothetical protein